MDYEGLNVVMLKGRLTKDPEPVPFFGGEVAAALHLAIRHKEGEQQRVDLVNVIWLEPDDSVFELKERATVWVLGHVRREGVYAEVVFQVEPSSAAVAALLSVVRP